MFYTTLRADRATARRDGHEQRRGI